MNIEGFVPIFLCASFGGLLVEVAKWHRIRESTNFPAYCRRPQYWILSLIMIFCGGGLATLYGIESKNAILVLNIGISAPLIVKALAEPLSSEGDPPTAPPPPDKHVPGYGMQPSHADSLRQPSIARFLAWR
jgi:hypothetical protein